LFAGNSAENSGNSFLIPKIAGKIQKKGFNCQKFGKLHKNGLSRVENTQKNSKLIPRIDSKISENEFLIS